ncbi:hypothetical protein [Plantibacter sp. RU18]|uniref:hypothetical protein n=1 Tax=Plantibacter sp. RU18 TaxID=3158143 RepID=UPI003D35E594
MSARVCFRCARELTAAESAFCGICATPILTLLGAHPGAGVSTLALATGFHDGHQGGPATTHPGAVRLLVGRTHVAGLGFVRDALSSGRLALTRVVLVPDAPGQLPKPLRDQISIISGVIPVTVTPWVESWRYAPGIEATRPVTKFFTALHAALVEQLPAPPSIESTSHAR